MCAQTVFEYRSVLFCTASKLVSAAGIVMRSVFAARSPRGHAGEEAARPLAASRVRRRMAFAYLTLRARSSVSMSTRCHHSFQKTGRR